MILPKEDALTTQTQWCVGATFDPNCVPIPNKFQFASDILKVTRLNNLRFSPHTTFHVHATNIHVSKCKRLHLWFHSTVLTSPTVSNRSVTHVHADGIRNWWDGYTMSRLRDAIAHHSNFKSLPSQSVIASRPSRFVHHWMKCNPSQCHLGWRWNTKLRTSTLSTLSIEKSLTWNEIK